MRFESIFHYGSILKKWGIIFNISLTMEKASSKRHRAVEEKRRGRRNPHNTTEMF